MTEPVIEARGVEKRFDGDGGGVLRGIDLAIPENETTVLMGPNGVGKTVLLACFAGGLHPSAGEVSVFGEPPTAVRSRFSFMLQGGLAVPELSGRENIAFYTDLHPAATDDWREITERMDLADLDRRVRDYSGGMVRKLELAIAMSVDVPLYLLDEPTAELDLTAVDGFHALVGERVAQGKTVVMTSHTPRDARAADRVVFVSEGRVVAEGDPDALLDSVPPVVRAAGRADIEALRKHVRGERFFESDTARRGFLTEGTTPEAVEGPGIQVEEPAWTDLFNYAVHVVPAEPSGTDDNGMPDTRTSHPVFESQ